jgi:alkanesulfonate monooxygenase SsuD/methylene tetrahydromethanopterin reductase-like flavin-dependent oxidoreductase (luciferase family)
MALKDRIGLGVSLPHRSPDAIPPHIVDAAARRAEALGFADLWVTENTLDHVFSFDPVAVLSRAAAVTRHIRLGVSVVVLPVHHPVHIAHQYASLDYLSGGRAILGVGLGRDYHYAAFQVPLEARVRRFREGVALVKALWTEGEAHYRGRIYTLEGFGNGLRPVQQPHPPIWMGVGHPDAIARAAAIADGWMGSGGSSIAEFGRSVPILKRAIEAAGRDPAAFPISKRVFLAIDERAEVARAELARWFATVYRNPPGTDASGIHGTPETVRERLEELCGMGANHLLLNPVSRYTEQIEACAEVAGLS